MNFKLTKHAKERMKRYNISTQQIEDALENPDRVIKGKFGRKIAQKRLNEKAIRVIYEGNLIITTYLARRERYEI